MSRPTVYKEEYCDLIIEMMHGGESITQVAVNIGVCRETLYAWARVHPRFSDSMKKARAASESYWENVLREGATGVNKEVNNTLLIFLMKSRFNRYKENYVEAREEAPPPPDSTLD